MQIVRRADIHRVERFLFEHLAVIRVLFRGRGDLIVIHFFGNDIRDRDDLHVLHAVIRTNMRDAGDTADAYDPDTQLFHSMPPFDKFSVLLLLFYEIYYILHMRPIHLDFVCDRIKYCSKSKETFWIKIIRITN